MKIYKRIVLQAAFACSAVLGLTDSALAGQILIINGISTSSEFGTTTQITNNLNSVLTAAGNTTTVVDGFPVSFAGYSQVWDLRFSNSAALNSSQQNQYLSYLQGGGGVFVMGENSNFMARNTSILSLIALAGGGTINFANPNSTQTVLAPFNSPNIIPDGNVTYNAPGGLSSAGTGQFITTDGTYGTGVAFSKGNLGNATAGALSTIFDVNFMQGIYDQPDSQSLLRNLAGFVADQVEPPSDVPEPASLALLALGIAGMRAARRKSA